MNDAERQLAELFESAAARFEEAAVRHETIVDHRIGGHLVRMRFACPTLVGAVGRAFAHLRLPTTSGEPSLTIDLWDSRSSGVTMPAPPWSLLEYTARGDIRGHDTARFRASFHVHSGILNMIDLATGRALYWINDAVAVPGYATSMPLLPILQWWMAPRGMQLVHAGVVGLPDGAALLAGQGGSGKSNTALSCVLSGLQYVSDDYALIQLDPQPRAHSVFGTARLHPADLARHPALQSRVSNPDNLASDKALFFLHDILPERLAADLPLRALLLPRVAEQKASTYAPAPTAAAYRALTAVTLHCLPGAGRATLDTIARTVRSLPCYFLNLGTDRSSVASAVRSLLEQAT